MGLAPVWITNAGSLGVVPEGRYFKISLSAYDPESPSDPTKVTYALIAGTLPAGVQVNTNGVVEGVPISIADFKGVPTEVAENVTSKFAIRVSDEEGKVADRTFTLTITGQDSPVWITPDGNIGTWTDGTELEFQFDAADSDPADTLEFSLVAGDLPSGLTLELNGRLHGYLYPMAGTDPTNIYDFTVKLSDSKDTKIRAFQITLNRYVGIYPPYITNNVSSIGSFKHGTYFAWQFEALDHAGDATEFHAADVGSEAVIASMGLTLDPYTGWLYGMLNQITTLEETYSFGVTAQKVVLPSVISGVYTTSIRVTGEVNLDVSWLSPSYLGTINNGDVSTFTVEATHPDFVLNYELVDGYLPLGLTLDLDGDIIGQTSFTTFSLDQGYTTFDSEYGTRLFVDPTTFDMTYTFTIRAFNDDETVVTLREFTIIVNRLHNVPYNKLYIRAMPPREDRILIDSLLSDDSVLVPDALYRINDPHFGKAKRVIYDHAYGLSPATVDAYLTAASQNHYNKQLTLGEVKTAKALDDNGDVMYEVVYSQVIDRAVNAKGESASIETQIKYPALHNGALTTTIYPNSLENMRERIVDTIGQQSKVLPRWMLSKQDDGNVLGFTAAWVIAYTNPGMSGLIKYNVDQFIGPSLNAIDFEADRYIVDAHVSDEVEQLFTTFDRVLVTSDCTVISTDSTVYDASRVVLDETTFDSGATIFTPTPGGIVLTSLSDRYVMFPFSTIVDNRVT